MPLKPRAPPTAFHVLKNDADDFAEAERDDGQIIPRSRSEGMPTSKPATAAANPPSKQRAEKNRAGRECGVQSRETIRDDRRRVSHPRP